jgi:uncharacterized protein YciI
VKTFLVVLRFAEHRSKAKELLAGHNAWIQHGFDDGAFLLVGSLQPGLGGVVLARAPSPAELEARVAWDPFVAERVVSVEILEIAPSRVDPRLDFLT